VTDTQVRIHVPGNHLMIGVLGQRDEHLRLVEENFPGAEIHVRGNEITVDGDQAATVAVVFEEIVQVLEGGQRLAAAEVARMIDMVKADERPSEVLSTRVLKAPNGRIVRVKSAGQKKYIEAVRQNIVTFAIGPAGTGKTWLAVAMAVEALTAKQVRRIVLTRPAVEAGERLGFLPGDLMAKVDPYLRPLYDALYDMFDGEAAEKLFERGVIEVAPLAFMRGRTLNDSFIILDEAQNTTPEQMKMFLTRIGFGSKVVVTGDTTQIDVPGGKSGLRDVEGTLDNVEGVAFARLGGRDIVRHRIVQDIVNAYDQRDAGRRPTS
jgi:phosphate starvation-inducible PhoH-like protein